MECSHFSRIVAGARLHWAERNATADPKSPPILLLHGLHDSHLTWKHIASHIAPGRRLLMPDLLGCGLSDRPDASYTLTWHAHVIGDWLHQLGLEQIDVVGHSLGGGIGQMLLLERRLKISRLALLASGGLGREVGFWLRLAAMSGVVEHLGQPFMAHGTWLALRGMRCRLPEHIAHLCEMNGRPGSARAFARTVRDVIDWRGQRRIFFERAHEVTELPAVAVYWGDADQVIPVAHGAAFADAVLGARFHALPGAGHYLHHEQPERVAELLNDFLSDPTAQRARIRPRIQQPSFVDRTLAPVLARVASNARVSMLLSAIADSSTARRSGAEPP